LLIRHADIDGPALNDPSLRGRGNARAEEFARVVSIFATNARRLKVIYASEAKRTQETVQPLSIATGIPITVVKAKCTDTLADRILSEADAIVVIAGHSNTIPPLIQALGGPLGLTIREREFDRLFALGFAGSSETQCVEMRYGTLNSLREGISSALK